MAKSTVKSSGTFASTAPSSVAMEESDPVRLPEEPPAGQPTFSGVAAQGVAGSSPRDSELMGVAARGIAAGEVPSAMPYDPARMDWENRSSWDAAAQIAASRRRLSPAVLSTIGVTMPPLPLITPPQEAPSEARSVLHAGVAASTNAGFSGRAELTLAPVSPAPDHLIKQDLSARPTDIRNGARALAAQFVAEAEDLKKSMPNDGSRLAAQKQLIDLFERMARGLGELADALDQAISKGTDGQLEPVFLGTAGKIADELRRALVEWLEENRTMVFDVPVKIALFGAGVAFLHSIGADSFTAIGGLTALVLRRGQLGKSSGRNSKKRARK